MAVSGGGPGLLRAVRTLAWAHGRMSLNASLRDSGLGLTVLGMVLLGLVVAALVLPLWGAAVGLGLVLAPALEGGPGLAWLAVAFTALPVGSAVLSLLAGDVRSLDWERLQAYPVPRAAFLLGEALASCLHPLMAGGLGAVLLLAGTLAVKVPGAAPGLLVVAATAAGLQLGLRLLLALGASWLVRHLRWALVGLGLLLVLGRLRADQAAGGPEPLKAAVRAGGAAVARWLPAAHQLDAVASHAGPAAAGLWWPLALPALLGWAAWALAFRPPSGPRAAGARPERLWTVRSPVLGVARLHLLALTGSDLGRLALAGPLVWVASVLPLTLVREGLPAFDPGWLAFSAWVMPPLLLTGLLGNQFGTDRGAIKALFLLPLDERTLLRGKALALGLVLAAYWALLTAGLLLLAPPEPLRLLAAAGCGLAAALLQLAQGQWTSLVWPRPIPRRGLKQPPGGLVPSLASLAGSAATTVPLAGLWLWLQDRDGALAGAALGAAAVAALAFAFFSRQAEGLMRLNRERLVETLS